MRRSRISNKNSFILERSIQARKRLSFVGKRIISPPRSCVLGSNIKVLKSAHQREKRDCPIKWMFRSDFIHSRVAIPVCSFMNGQRIKRRSSLRVRIIPYSLSRAFVKTISLSSWLEKPTNRCRRIILGCLFFSKTIRSFLIWRI